MDRNASTIFTCSILNKWFGHLSRCMERAQLPGQAWVYATLTISCSYSGDLVPTHTASMICSSLIQRHLAGHSAITFPILSASLKREQVTRRRSLTADCLLLEGAMGKITLRMCTFLTQILALNSCFRRAGNQNCFLTLEITQIERSSQMWLS